MPRPEAAEKNSDGTIPCQANPTGQRGKLIPPGLANARIKSVDIRPPWQLVYFASRHFGRHGRVQRRNDGPAPLSLLDRPPAHRSESETVQSALQASRRVDHRGVYFQKNWDA